MPFLKAVWTFLVGIKDALVLLALVLFFGLIWALFAGPSTSVSVTPGSALHIQAEGLLVDQASTPAAVSMIAGEPVIPEIETADLVRLIDMAAADKQISMITLDLDGFLGGGQANLESVGAALARFKKTGKPVETWATLYSDDSYFLAAHASHIAVSPQGGVLFTGPGGTNLYFKEALDKLKVNIEVFRVGTFKSAVEPYTLTKASPEAKAADQLVADDLWRLWQAGVEAQRPNLDISELVANWSTRMTGANRNQAEMAKSVGLVDAVLTENQWFQSLAKRLGKGQEPEDPRSFKQVSAADYWMLKAPFNESGPAVAVVHVNGAIVDGQSPSGQAGGETVSDLIYQAIADKDTKALVVRVDSGGGSVTASEQIRQALLDAKARKIPVVASFGPVAASGGYWVGAAADKIYASPSTITGSIGVFGLLPTFERTLADFGITSDSVTTTPYSGQPDVVGGINEPTRAVFQSSVENTYNQFLTIVAEARKMPVAQVAPIAEGRIWSGTQAKSHKLIDAYGDLSTAVAEASRLAGASKPLRTMVVRQAQPFWIEMLSIFGGGASAQSFGATEAEQAGLKTRLGSDALGRMVQISRLRAVAQVSEAMRVAKGPSVQAHCLSCTKWRATPTPDVAKQPELALLAGKLLS